MSTRQIIFGIDPRGSDPLTFTLVFDDIQDGNEDLKAFTCGYYPPTKGAGSSLAQESIFLGTTTDAGLTFQALRDDKTQDGTTAITARAITQRIDPDARPDANIARSKSTKRFLQIAFNGKAPSDLGLDVYYAKDSDPIKDPAVTWIEATSATGDTQLEFEDGLADWLNLKFETTVSNVDDEIISAFDVIYYGTGSREGRDS